MFESTSSFPTNPLTVLNQLTNQSSRVGSVTLTNSVVRSGSGAVKFEYLKTDAAKYNASDPNAMIYQRAELRKSDETEKELWYGFSSYFPSSYVADPIAECVFQWHDQPDTHLGEKWRSPALNMLTQGDKFKFQVRYAASTVNTNATATLKQFDLGTIPKNQWIDWVLHIKFSYGSDGILEVWKNGVKVISYMGPNCYNDVKLPYFKMGVYKWDWTDNPTTRNTSPESGRTLYFDNLRIGNRNATYAEVVPR